MTQDAVSCGQPNDGLELGGRESAANEATRSRLRTLQDFEKLRARLSAAFINLPPEGIDGQIGHGLQQLVEFLGVDRSGIAQFSEDGGQLTVTHWHARPNVAPPGRIDVAPLLTWYTARIRAGELLRFARLPDELPAEATHERDMSRRYGIQSHLMMPLTVGGSVLGGLGLGSLTRQRDWPDELVQSLRLVADLFANALARQQAGEREARLREQLALAGRVTVLGEVAASIAHEVNQPLCAIVSNAQAVRRLLDGPHCDMAEVREALADIARDGQRASAVVARIRNFVRKGVVERAPVAVNDLIREAAALLHGEMLRRGVAVRLDLLEGLPPAQGDRVQLLQVLVNLMTNAADAMGTVVRELRKLAVRSGTDGKSVTVAVQDAGPGIAPEHARRLFEPFFTTKPGGMGMGLSICRSIVESHGGRIRARPQAEWGSTFEFTLPVAGGATHD